MSTETNKKYPAPSEIVPYQKSAVTLVFEAAIALMGIACLSAPAVAVMTTKNALREILTHFRITPTSPAGTK